MKALRIVLFSALALLFIFSAVLAVKHDAVERGKTYFNDPKFAGGTAGKSCATCHPDGDEWPKRPPRKNGKIPRGM